MSYTPEQIAAARLRLVLDRKLGRKTPGLVRQIASQGTEDKQARTRR